MKLINSILLSIIALLPLAAHTAEKRVTIFTSEGYEKELVIDVPSQLMGQEEHYTKAYILNYMRWWNMGVGTTKRNARKYQFDLTHFNENTPPRQISRQAEAAADRHFSKDDFWAKVVAEGDRFINDINHKSDSSETGMVSLSIKPTGGGGGELSIEIPKEYSRRAKEYAYQYAYSYAKLWNSIIFNGNPMKLSAYHDSFKYINTHYFIGEEYEDIIVGGDVKNKLKKLFDTPEMRARVIKDQMARAERQAKE